MANIAAKLVITAFLAGTGTLHGALAGMLVPTPADRAIGLQFARTLPAHGEASLAAQPPGTPRLEGVPAPGEPDLGLVRVGVLRTVVPGSPASRNPIGMETGPENSPVNEPGATIPRLQPEDSLQTPGTWTLLLLAVGLVAYQLRRQAKVDRGIVRF